MAAVPSTMVSLGTKAPNFLLLEPLTQKAISINSVMKDKGLVVMFICNHCPYVKHLNKAIVELANDYLHKGIGFIGINSNDVSKYPSDSPDEMIKVAQEHNYPFPYVIDETQETAKAFSAACTPDFFVYNTEFHLVYRGQFDSSRPGNSVIPDGKDIRHALDCLLSSTPNLQEQIPSIGCNIKWK